MLFFDEYRRCYFLSSRDPVCTRVIPSVVRDLPVSRRSLGVKNTPRDDTGFRDYVHIKEVVYNTAYIR